VDPVLHNRAAAWLWDDDGAAELDSLDIRKAAAADDSGRLYAGAGGWVDA